MADRLVCLAGIIGCPGAVEVLDALADTSCAFAELGKAARVPRGRLERVLRTLAAEGAVRQSRSGSWDARANQDTAYVLTAAGHRLAADLADIDVWTAFYERHLNG